MKTPSYRLHKASGQAVVTLNGRDHYLGAWDSPASNAEYDRLIREWLSNGRRIDRGGDLTVSELIRDYLEHVERYYRKGGEPTSEKRYVLASMRPLKKLYGHTIAADFGPLALRAVRDEIVADGISRNVVNGRVRRIVRLFKWAAEFEKVPASVHHGLVAVAGLRKGRSEARESDPVRPVPGALVDAIRPHVNRQVWAMIELQRLTGMRPGEVCIMRTGDLDTSGRIWTYTPGSHKTEHDNQARVVYLGPAAQAIIESWLRTEPTEYLFQPIEAATERRAEQRRNRKSPVSRYHKTRRKKAPKTRPGDRYSPDSYRTAIRTACAHASPHPELGKVEPGDMTAEQRAELKR